MKWYNHRNPSVVVSTDGKEFCTYYEVINGGLREDRVAQHDHHREAVASGSWREITQGEAYRIISSVLGERYPKDSSLSPLFTEIDIHMFSSGEVNELRYN